MTREDWLANHPYLQSVAQFQALVDRTVLELSVPRAPVPNWPDYAADFHAGIPVLQSGSVAIDFDSISGTLNLLVQRLNSEQLPIALATSLHDLATEVQVDRNLLRSAVAWLVGRGTFSTKHSGLIWYAGWAVMTQHFSALTGAFDNWRDEEQWLRNYCPVCGTPPAMAQLVRIDPGRIRYLSCGCCHTRWRYRRDACPFCETGDDDQMAILAIDGENGLRIDHCKKCRGYLKTFNGTGSEDIMLADWSSLHLDILALDRGFERRASSLYDFSR